MQDLVLHPQSQLALQAYIQQPPHALLLTGAESMGKQFVALSWAKNITPLPIFTVRADEKDNISIETIRNLYKQTRGKKEARQVILIANAQHMSLEAENAFLKLLEEPRSGVTFILTAPRANMLLPTITSRTQHVALHSITDSQIHELLVKNRIKLTPNEHIQLLFIAQGRPALALQLASQASVFEAAKIAMQQAKDLLSKPAYQRFLAINRLAADRQTCISVLENMLYISSFQAKKSKQAKDFIRWTQLCDMLQDCLQYIAQNGNLRAQLLALFARW